MIEILRDLEDRPKSMPFKKQMEMIPFGKSVKVTLFGNRTNNIWKPAIIQSKAFFIISLALVYLPNNLFGEKSR